MVTIYGYRFARERYPCTSIERDCHVFPRGLWTGHVHYRICTLLHGHTVKMAVHYYRAHCRST